MSNPTFDTVETTLKSLKDIVDRNHPDSAETSQLVKDMELLIAEMKVKTHDVLCNNLDFEPPALVIHSSAIMSVQV